MDVGSPSPGEDSAPRPTPARPPPAVATAQAGRAARAGRDPARRPHIVSDAAELVGQPELALRPDPGAGRGPHDDRSGALPDERQGLLQGSLLLGAGARPGDLLGPVLRGPDLRGSSPDRTLLAGAEGRRRDHRLRRLVG